MTETGQSLASFGLCLAARKAVTRRQWDHLSSMQPGLASSHAACSSSKTCRCEKNQRCVCVQTLSAHQVQMRAS